MVKRCPRPFLWSSEAAYKINRGFDLNGQDVSMVWYLYTVVKYIRRMHFSFVEFATNSYENKRLLVGSDNY